MSARPVRKMRPLRSERSRGFRARLLSITRRRQRALPDGAGAELQEFDPQRQRYTPGATYGTWRDDDG